MWLECASDDHTHLRHERVACQERAIAHVEKREMTGSVAGRGNGVKGSDAVAILEQAAG